MEKKSIPLKDVSCFVSDASRIPGTYINQLPSWSSKVFFHGLNDHFSLDNMDSIIVAKRFSMKQ